MKKIKNKLKLLIIVPLMLLAGACTWEDTLWWDDQAGLPHGTTNHIIYTVHGQNMQAPGHTHPWEKPPPPASSWGNGDDYWRLAGCETGYKYNNPNTGNGYYGYFQFDLQTWRSVGGPGYPHHHSYEVQKSYAQKLQAQRGWGPWPSCSRQLGLR